MCYEFNIDIGVGGGGRHDVRGKKNFQDGLNSNTLDERFQNQIRAPQIQKAICRTSEQSERRSLFAGLPWYGNL